MRTGHDHTWFVLTQKIIEKEFALSGSEQNPDLTGKDVRAAARTRVAAGRAGAGRGVQGARRGLRRRATTCAELVAGHERAHRRAADRPRRSCEREVVARDREIDNPFTKDLQVTAIRGARRYRGDQLIRVAAPHQLLDPRPAR